MRKKQSRKINNRYDNIYVHVPFCSSKCGYCAFHSVTGYDDDLLSAYIERLRRELDSYRGLIADKVRSVYIGGGTPSILPPELLINLFEMLDLSEDAEISIECNPETLDKDKAQIICSHVNRVSLGVQSFKANRLEILGRRATVGDVMRALQLLSDCGIENLSVDLIYAIASQSVEDFLDDLRLAVESGAGHISAYALTIEESSKLAAAGSVTADEDRSVAMYKSAERYLRSKGFEHYEISNYARKSFKCRHNCNVWAGESYLGLGASAVSFDGVNRRRNPRLNAYMRGGEAQMDIISAECRCREIFAVGLRCADNWTRKRFENLEVLRRCALDFDCFRNCGMVGRLAETGLLNVRKNSIKLSVRGRLFHDYVAGELIFP